jgi:hypothetical protein
VRVAYRAGVPVAAFAEAVRLPQWRIHKLVRDHDWPDLPPESVPTLPFQPESDPIGRLPS